MVSKTLDDIADKVRNAMSYLEVKALYETYDVENNIMIDAIIDKYSVSERDMAIQHINNMYSILGTGKKILIIFDRGYISLNLLISLNKLPIKNLLRYQMVLIL